MVADFVPVALGLKVTWKVVLPLALIGEVGCVVTVKSAALVPLMATLGFPLSAKLKPIEERLAKIAAKKAKLADDRVVRNMNNNKFRELKDNLDRGEVRIRALRAEIDPAQIEELESTKGILRFWTCLISIYLTPFVPLSFIRRGGGLWKKGFTLLKHFLLS